MYVYKGTRKMTVFTGVERVGRLGGCTYRGMKKARCIVAGGNIQRKGTGGERGGRGTRAETGGLQEIYLALLCLH